MYDLDTIIRLNKQAAETYRRFPASCWTVESGNGRITVQGFGTDVRFIVNALSDSELLNFHREWTGPAWVAARVEHLTLEIRRAVRCAA